MNSELDELWDMYVDNFDLVGFIDCFPQQCQTNASKEDVLEACQHLKKDHMQYMYSMFFQMLLSELGYENFYKVLTTIELHRRVDEIYDDFGEAISVTVKNYLDEKHFNKFMGVH